MPEVGGIAGDRLKSFIERAERLEEEKRALAADLKEVFAEAEGCGFDVKIMRKIIRRTPPRCRCSRRGAGAAGCLPPGAWHARGPAARPLGRSKRNSARSTRIRDTMEPVDA